MAKQTSPIRMAGRKSEGKQNAKNKPRSKIDSQRQIKIQKALYEIADAASAVMDMQSFYKRLHEIVGTLMYAGNFFIATYNEQSGLLSFPYCVDEVDPTPAPQPLSEFHGMTSWIIRTGYMGKRGWDQSNELVASGEIEMVGTPNEDGMIAPLKAEGKVIGVVAVQSYTKGIGYTDEDEQVLEFVAQHIAIALTRARAIEETRQRNSELAILNSVGEAMARTLDVKTVARIVGDKVRDIFSADQIGILLYEQQTNLMYLIYGYDKANNRYVNDIQIKPIPLGKGLTSKVIESRQPLLLGTREEQDAHGHYMPAELKGQIKPSESWLGVPIMVNEMVLGVVLVEDYRTHVYNENHLRLLQTLSSNMGVAIQNARLFEETQQRNAELAIINSIQQGLASKLDMQGIYDLVGDAIGGIFPDAEVVLIYSIDPHSKRLDVNYAVEKGQRFHLDPDHYENKPYEAFYNKLAYSTEPLVVNNNSHAFMIENGLYVVEGTEEPRSVVFVPLIAGEQVISQISIQNVDRENAFNNSDIRLLQTLANAMSVALENARLWEQEKLYRKALQRELEIGREIQSGFLPETLPQVEGWEIAASLMSAREVAGDFYDAFELPDGTISLVIADVCDKGVGAALFMTLFRSLIRVASNLEYFEHTESVNTSHSTAERLKRAVQLTNNYIAETHGESGMFATLFFGILDPRDGRLTYINGGHEPPLIIRAGSVRETLRKTGPAVGAITNGYFDLIETQLQTGELFVAFTDGVPDCKNPSGEFYGRKRLLEVLQEAGSSSGEMVKAMETDLHQYIAGATQFDDITLMVVKRVN